VSLTFRQLKDGPVARAAGMDVESCDFLQICRDAVRQLMTRGDFWSDVVPVDCCVCVRGELVWPRGVSTILAMNVNGEPIPLANRWYNFRPMNETHYQWGWDYQRRGFRGNITGETNGVSPVFNQITSPGFKIRTFISNPNDVGKKITYCGIDKNGQVARAQRDDGTWQDGFQVTLANPYVDSPEMQRVTRVVKEETFGYLNAYQYNIAQGFLLDLAQYQPSETNPEYIVTKIVGHQSRYPFGAAGWGNGFANVNALVKLNFIPFKFDDDPVQIDNVDAIRDMVYSIRKKDQGDLGASVAYEASAVRELNRQAESKMPDDTMVIENRTFGGAIPHRRLF